MEDRLFDRPFFQKWVSGDGKGIRRRKSMSPTAMGVFVNRLIFAEAYCIIVGGYKPALWRLWAPYGAGLDTKGIAIQACEG